MATDFVLSQAVTCGRDQLLAHKMKKKNKKKKQMNPVQVRRHAGGENVDHVCNFGGSLKNNPYEVY